MKTSIQNYLNGEFFDPINKRWMDNIEPATGEVYGQIPESDDADVEQAVIAAEQALPHWKGLSQEQRAEYLLAIADEIDQQLDTLAQAESMDNGKAVALAKMVDIPRASSNFRFFAHAATQFSSESHEMPGEAINYTLRHPVGVVACISPWNLPLYLFTWKIAPALASGNCVIAKPSEVTPMTAYLLAKICQKVGLPKGVLNILHGSGGSIGNALVSHPKIKAISFTGGTRTGAHIASIAAPKFKKLSLELGGKNPTLVFADCDFEHTVNEVARSAFANQGQICLCGSRIYVEHSIYEEFKQALVAKVSELKVGDPNDPSTNVGAVVSKPHMEKVLGHIEIAKQEGGNILCGGEQVKLEGRCENGYFIQPTLIEGLDNQCRTNQEEIFGPVATIQPFESDEQAIELANHSEYGLATSVWTQNLNRAHVIAEQIQTGIVWINCWLHRDLRTPFGGMKNSGVGREGGLEALRFFTEPKNVCIKYR